MPVSDPLSTQTAVTLGRLGKYQLLQRLSEGGMAELFLAVTDGPGGFRKPVVLKRILEKNKFDGEFLQMFLDEARIGASLWHANIAQVFDLDCIDGEYFLAMEYIPGKNLREILTVCAERQKPLPLGFACRVVREVCLGLHHAHDITDLDGRPVSVVHRDIAPRNLMVAGDGSVKIIDFGIAQAKWRVDREVGYVKGTSGYMSPEQLRGTPLDGRSDLFSLGIVLYESLLGVRLFQHGDDRKMVEMILHDPVKPPHEVNPAIPESLSKVVMTALQRTRDGRFATGKDMAKAIDAAVGSAVFDADQCASFMRELFGPLTRDADRFVAGEVARALRSADPDPPTKSDPMAAEKQTMRIPAIPQLSASNILIVDDSPTVIAAVTACLGPLGYKIAGCGTPSQALARLQEDSVDLVLLDLIMPEMNGFELCRLIRERAATQFIPILFLSSACSLEERVQCLSVGGDDFIRKPFEPAELVARVRAHLQRIDRLKAMVKGGGRS